VAFVRAISMCFIQRGSCQSALHGRRAPVPKTTDVARAGIDELRAGWDALLYLHVFSRSDRPSSTLPPAAQRAADRSYVDRRRSTDDNRQISSVKLCASVFDRSLWVPLSTGRWGGGRGEGRPS